MMQGIGKRPSGRAFGRPDCRAARIGSAADAMTFPSSVTILTRHDFD
jgi:hypothetical protein